MSKVKADDVARTAGLSRAAVSRAFRQDGPISEDKRARILSVAEQLGYRPPSAEAVAKITDRTITLVAADLENPFYPVVANAFSQAIHGSGRRLILHLVPPRQDVDTVLRQVMDYRSEAAIVTSSLMSSRIAKECRAHNMPVVLFNRVQSDRQMTAVTCDNYGGGRLAAEHFINLGRRHIALLGGRHDTSTHLERRRGFQDRLEEAGLRLYHEANGAFDYDTAFFATRRLLEADSAPDALFCLNDIMALAALDAARGLNIPVPDELAVIGFDDIPMSGWPAYRLTTIRQPLQRMVADTLELIDRQKNNPGEPGVIRVAAVELIKRATA